MDSLHSLSDNLLIESYKEATNFKLNADFIKILEQEIKKRDLLDQIS